VTTSLSIARFFDATGYFKSPDVVPDALVDRMALVVKAHLDRAVPPFRVNAVGEVCRVDGILDRDSVFLEALRSAAVADPLREILGPTVDVVRNRHNHATRNAAGDIPFRLHRDVQQWSQPLVAVFIYLEESTVQNGCTVVVPSSHRVPYAGWQSGGGGGNWADEHGEYEIFIGQELPIEMPRGGVLFMNCLTFHSVGPHRVSAGGRSRYSVVFACRATDELATVESPDVVRLFGQRRYLASSRSKMSGSLRQGTLERWPDRD
jgi:ectoine hydroxylase-related dioxygenase (phytanoyl-CoA dioxygenase family)